MHSYTLSNWDGSLSQKEATSDEVQSSNSNPKHMLSHGRDGLILKTPSGTASKNDVQQGNDANYGTEVLEHRNQGVADELENRGRVTNRLKKTARGVEQDNKAADALAAVISQAYSIPASSSRSQSSSIKTNPNGRTQDQAKTIPSHSQAMKPGPTATRINVHTGPTNAQSAHLQDTQGPVGLLKGPLSGLTTKSPTIIDTYVNFLISGQDATSMVARSQQAVSESETQIVGRNLSRPVSIVRGGADPILARQSAGISPPERPELDILSVARGPKAEGTHRFNITTPKGSRSSIVSNTTPGGINNYLETLPSKYTPLAGQQPPPTTLPPSPTHIPHSISTHRVSHSHSPQTSLPCTNLLAYPHLDENTVPSSVPSSPILCSDLLLCDTHHNSDDEYTSADADGESIDEINSELLEPSQARIQSHASVSLPTLTNTFQTTQFPQTNGATIHTSSHISHTSVYNLFTPPPTQLSSQTPIQSIKQDLSVVTRLPLFLLHVEIPPLPPGVHKTDYRPLKRLKRVHEGGCDTRYDGGGSLEKGLREKREALSKDRERRDIAWEGQRLSGQEINGHHRFVPYAPTAELGSAYVAYQEQIQRKKSILSNLPIRPSEKNPQKNSAPEKRALTPDEPEEISSASTSTTPRRLLAPSFTLSAPPGRPKPRAGSTTFVAPVPAVHRPPSKFYPPASNHTLDTPTSLQEPTTRKIQVHTAQHPTPTATYFNTRFVRTWLNNDLSEWTALGSQVTTGCSNPERFDWDQRLSSDDSEREAGLNFCVGGTVLWRGCASGDEEDEMPLTQRSETLSMDVDAATGRNSADATVTPIPTIDLTKVLKERTLTARRAHSTKKRNADTRARVGPCVKAADPAVSAISQSQLQPLSPQVPEPRPQPPPYLSEKARGKQKAIDSTPSSTNVQGDARFATLSSPSSTQDLPGAIPYSLMNAAASPYRLFSPYEEFDRSMEEYVAFDLPPDKSQNPVGGRGDSASASTSATTPLTIVPGFAPSPEVAQQDRDPFRPFQVNTDLFPLPHDSGLLVSNDLDGLEVSDPYYHDPLGGLMNEGKESQLMTVNPAFLGGTPDDAHTIVDGMELEFGVFGGMNEGEDAEIEDQRPQAFAYEKKLAEIKSRYGPIAGSPIISPLGSSPSTSSTSSRPSQSLTSTPARTRSNLPVVGRTSSPEFPDHYTSTRLSGEEDVQLSISKSPMSILHKQHTPSRPHTQVLDISGGEEEEEVRQGLEAVDAFSTSDDDFVPLSDSEDERSARLTRPIHSAAERHVPKRLPQRPAAVSTPTPVVVAPRRGQEWECGESDTFCHQCRRRSRRLKMTCLCNKNFCNRCITVRYPSIQFRLQWDGFDCPCCLNECNCDQCSRKRGEDYVSLRVSLKQFPEGGSVQRTLRPQQSMPLKVRLPLSPEIIPLSSPESTEAIDGPFSFWGSIYDLKGNKIATGFAGPDDRVIVAKPVDGYKDAENVAEPTLPAARTFIGACQPSWKLGRAPIIKELGKRGRSRRINYVIENAYDVETRWFVGKEHLLHCPVVVYSRDLAPMNPFSDMSSLSSLSGDSDFEVDNKTPPVADRTIFVNTSSIKSEASDSGAFDSNTVETRDTVRALLATLELCGLMVEAEQSIVNL